MTTECWDMLGTLFSCMATCSGWLSMTSPPIFSTACAMDQCLPTVPQVWDQIAYSEHMHYYLFIITYM